MNIFMSKEIVRTVWDKNLNAPFDVGEITRLEKATDRIDVLPHAQ